MRGGGGGFSPMCAGEVAGGEESSGDFEHSLDASFGVEGVVGVWRGEGLLHVVLGEEGFEVVAGVAGAVVGVNSVNWARGGVLGPDYISHNFCCLILTCV